MNREDNINSSCLQMELVECILKCLIQPKTHKVAKIQLISQFTLSERGSQHTKLRNGE